MMKKKKRKATKGSTRKGRRRVTKVGGENRCSCQSQDTIVDHGPLRRKENKVTSSVYMRVCASTYGTKEEEEDTKRVPSVSKKGNEERSAAAAAAAKVR